MRQRTNGAFTQFNTGLNAWDFINSTGVAYAASRTPGQSPYTPLFPTQGIGQKWKLLSVSVQGYLGYVIGDLPAGFQGPATYGKLGKLVAGLPSLDIPVTALPPVAVLANQIPLLQQPNDSSLLSTLWDPAVNEMPPTIPNPTDANNRFQIGQLLAVNTQISPPQPLDMLPGVTPALAVWLQPSLFGWRQSQLTSANAFGLALFYTTYTVNYDDGH